MIHSSAIIDPTAVIADDVCIGPYSVIGPDVKIDAGCEIKSHVVINGPT
ncbi:MAG: acyl-[acyl-carrier-protein]--UDP-N-acetylglucosamine O-acyltransferase, partial [Gammaproteobacteria bacterium]|nr:acyl-[acyl-carrier-protein]--UDP-N-acetylglucosamine O-acyltransferase [Gammaproteobacteria bacterium]